MVGAVLAGGAIVPPAGAQTSGGFSASPPSLAFGNQLTGTVGSSERVTLGTASAQASAQLSAVSVTRDFVFAGGSCQPGTTVSAKSPCTADVAFAPTVAGDRRGTITFVFTTDAFAPVTVVLSGTGADPVTTTTPVVDSTTTTIAVVETTTTTPVTTEPVPPPPPGTPGTTRPPAPAPGPGTTTTTVAPPETPPTTPAPAPGDQPPVTSELSAATTLPPPPPSGGPAPSTGATVEATTAKGVRSGPPGAGLAVTGSGYPPGRGRAAGRVLLAAASVVAPSLPDCPTVFFFLDGSRLGEAQPNGAGGVRRRDLSVPGDSAPGGHAVTSSCRASGAPVMASSEFRVTDAAVHRTAFVTSLPRPDEVSFKLERVVLSAMAVVAMLLLIAFPSELFNTTLEEHYDEVRGWFHRPPRRAGAAGGRANAALFASFVALSGPLWFVMQPTFKLDASTLVGALGLSLATLVVVVVADVPTLFHHHRRYGERARLVALPGTLVVALACVAFSRAVHFQPGYFYGLVAGLAFGRQLNEDTTGRLAARSALTVIALSVAAWLAFLPVSAAARRPGAGLGPILVENVLGGIFWVALDSLFIALMPLRLLEGAKVMAWSRWRWALLYGAALFAFVHVLLRPSTGYVSNTNVSPPLLVIGLFVGFATFSFAFWGYFRFRRPRAEAPPPVAVG